MDVQLRVQSNLGVIGSVSDFAYRWSMNAGIAPEEGRSATLEMPYVVQRLFAKRPRSRPVRALRGAQTLSSETCQASVDRFHHVARTYRQASHS